VEIEPKEPAEKKPITSMADAFFKAASDQNAATDAKKSAGEQKSEEIKATPASTAADDVKFTGKKAADWKALHTDRDTWKTKAEKLDADMKALNDQLAEAKKQPVVDPKELDALRVEKQALLDRMDKAFLEHDPRFETHFSKIEGDAIKAAKDAVGADRASEIEELIQTPPTKARKEQLAAIMSEMENESDKVNLALAIRDMDAARNEKKEKLSKAKEYRQQLKDADAVEIAKRNESIKLATESMTSEALKFANTLSAFQPVEGADGHNAAIVERQDRVRRVLAGKMTNTELRDLPVLAEEAKHLRETVLPLLLDENKKLRTAMDAMTKSNPSLQGGAGSAKSNEKKPIGFIDAFTKAMTPRSQ